MPRPRPLLAGDAHGTVEHAPPLPRPPVNTPWLSPAEAAAWRLRRVLVVDDVEGMRMVSEALLHQLGIRQVLLADSAEAALNLLRQQAVDLVLCDWRMPGMDGLQLRQQLLTLPRLKDLPFVLMSADAEPEQLATARQAGAHAVLTKPFGPPALTTALRQAVAEARGQGEAAQAATEALPSLLLAAETPARLRGLVDSLQALARLRVANSAERVLAICQTEEAPELVLLVADESFCPTLAQRLLQAGHAVVLLDDDPQRRRQALDAGALDAFAADPAGEADRLLDRLRGLLRWLHARRHALRGTGGASRDDKVAWQALASHDPSTPLAAALSELEVLLQQPDNGSFDRLQSIEQSLLEGLAEWQLSTGLALIAAQRFQLKARAVALRRLAERGLRLVLAENLHRGLRGECNIPGALRGPQALQASGDPLLCQTVLWLLLRALARAAPDGGLLRIEVQAMGDQGWRLQLLADEARLDPQAPQIAPARALLQAQRAALQLAQRGSTACIGIELPRGMALP